MGLFNKNRSASEVTPVERDLGPPLPDARTAPEPYDSDAVRDEALERGRDKHQQNQALERPPKQALFLMTLRKTGNVSRACKAADISRATAYTWKENAESNPEGGDGFSARWAEVVGAYVDDLETEVDRRAFSGDDVPVVYQGELQYDVDPKTNERTLVTLKRYSDALASLRLKALRPDKYRERNETHHTGGTENTQRVIFTMPDNGRDK